MVSTKLEDYDLFSNKLSDDILIATNVNGYDIEPGADLSGADLQDANLRNANLSGADMTDADLNNANLQDADLSGADLTNANAYDLYGGCPKLLPEGWVCGGYPVLSLTYDESLLPPEPPEPEFFTFKPFLVNEKVEVFNNSLPYQIECFDGEFLKIIDRKKDIIITSGGKNVSPSEIENNIKTSPFIKEAIVIGDDRKFLSALIGIEYDIVSNWALRKNIAHTTYRNLSENEEVQNLIWEEIQKANEYTSSLQIRKFRMLTKELDHEDGDLTATQKAKRNVIMDKFSDLIEEMYK